MSNFQEINSIIVPSRFVEHIYEHLRSVGQDGVEGVGLWLGRQERKQFMICSSVIPTQRAYRLEEGLLYQVGGDELYRINKWAYEQQLLLLVQIHSHPYEAYHSETDDAYPIVATLGGLSIVIPNFGNDPIDKKYWKVYRLNGDGWKEMSVEEVDQLFQII